MNYEFPKIEHIDQVRDAIKGRSEFVEYNRGDYIVFNYHVAFEDSFPVVKSAGGSAASRQEAQFKKSILRECRGLIFNKEGRVLSRRLHKFFNLNERQETEYSKVDWSESHILLEKLDGSMITPLMLPDGLKWATKMGVTDIGLMCEAFVKSSKIEYIPFVKDLIENNMTPIFEFMSPRTRIVIDHSEEKLTLIAIRENTTGKYYKYENMLEVANYYNIPVVAPLSIKLDNVKELSDTEGVVVRFKDGHMLKVKTDWYVAIHKMKENLLFEKNVLDLILNEKVDDILPMLPANDAVRLKNYQKELLENIDLEAFILWQHLAAYEKNTRKHFALEHAGKLHPLQRTVIFNCWGNPEKSIREEIITYIKSNCLSSQTKVDFIRYLLPEKW